MQKDCSISSNSQRRTPKVKLPLIGCTDDMSAVIALPDTWTPKRSSAVLTNYLKERETQHETVLNDIQDEADMINKDIDSKISALAQTLLTHIQENQNNIDVVVNEGNLTAYPHGFRNEAVDLCRKLHNERTEYITEFRKNALALERDRAEAVKHMLRKHFQRLISIGHKKPKDLLHEFDEKIYCVNQQILSNKGAYLELEGQLQSHNDFRLMRARSKINQLFLGFKTCNRRSSTFSTYKAYTIMEHKPEMETPMECMPADQIRLNIAEFERCVNRTVEAYRTGVMHVFTSFFDKFRSLEKSLDSHVCSSNEGDKYLKDLAELQNMIHRASQNLATIKLNSQISLHEMVKSARSYHDKMQQSLASLGDQLRDTYIILYEAGHLWDPHLMRLAHAQKLTITAAEDLITNNDIIELSHEVSINIALEQLRCCPDIEKLYGFYDNLNNLLQHAAEMYQNHCDAEINRLEEFMNLPPLMSTLLLNEFNCFLEKYPRPFNEVPQATSNSAPETPKNYQLSSRSPIPRAILQTELQKVALENWRCGFLESIQNNVPTIPNELQRHARMWTDEKIAVKKVRRAMKMSSHSVRLERMNTLLRIRQDELKYHEDRLESHLQAIHELLAELMNGAAEFLSIDSPELYPYCEWIDDLKLKVKELLESDPDPEVKRLKMMSYPLRIAKHRQHFETSLLETIEFRTKQAQHCFQAARISNLAFIKKIKLFSEGGTYAAAEATKASSAIAKAGDTLEDRFQKFKDALELRKQELLGKADEYIQQLLIDVGAKQKNQPHTKQGSKNKKKDGKKPKRGKT